MCDQRSLPLLPHCFVHGVSKKGADLFWGLSLVALELLLLLEISEALITFGTVLIFLWFPMFLPGESLVIQKQTGSCWWHVVSATNRLSKPKNLQSCQAPFWEPWWPSSCETSQQTSRGHEVGCTVWVLQKKQGVPLLCHLQPLCGDVGYVTLLAMCFKLLLGSCDLKTQWAWAALTLQRQAQNATLSSSLISMLSHGNVFGSQD